MASGNTWQKVYDKLSAWYGVGLPTKGTQDLWVDFWNGQVGYVPSNQDQFDWYGSRGATGGSLSERADDFWNNVAVPNFLLTETSVRITTEAGDRILV